MHGQHIQVQYCAAHAGNGITAACHVACMALHTQVMKGNPVPNPLHGVECTSCKHSLVAPQMDSWHCCSFAKTEQAQDQYQACCVTTRHSNSLWGVVAVLGRYTGSA